MLIGAARIGNFIGRHTGIANKDAFVIWPIGAQYFFGWRLIIPAPMIVAPYAFVKAIVKVVVFKMFKFAARC